MAMIVSIKENKIQYTKTVKQSFVKQEELVFVTVQA